MMHDKRGDRHPDGNGAYAYLERQGKRPIVEQGNLGRYGLYLCGRTLKRHMTNDDPTPGPAQTREW